MTDTSTTPEPEDRAAAGNPDVQDDPDDEVDQDAESPDPGLDSTA